MNFEIPYYVWLIIAVLFLIVEIFTAGFFFACFVVGALGALVTGWLGGNYVWQIIAFCVVSVALIPVSRIIARRVSDDSVPQAGADALIGLTGIVTDSIIPDRDLGKVLVDGQPWRATASGNIDKDARVKVVNVRGAKLIVEVIQQ
jgi:membrane protein implicated in regulation of membrane protease activity